MILALLRFNRLYQWALPTLLAIPAFAQTLHVPGGTVGTSSNANVGIGITTPRAKLHVESGTAISFIFGANNGGIYPSDAFGGALTMNHSGGQGEVSFWNAWSNPPTTSFNFKQLTGTSSATTLMTLRADGNVGIGTASPLSKLHINANTAHSGSEAAAHGLTISTGMGGQSLWMGYDASADVGYINAAKNGSIQPIVLQSRGGNVGIGKTGPSARLDVQGESAQNTYTVNTNASADIRVLSADNRPNDGAVVTLGGAWGVTGYLKTAALNGPAGAVVIGNRREPTDNVMQPGIVLDISGNVGIGTTTPAAKLAVNGTIRAKEVIVDTGWSDYVFADEYRLAPLSEIEAHIKEKGHLPGIPSAAEVKAGGVSLGDMQSKLLAKVEELTLHLIEMKKENAELRQKFTKLERR